MRDWPVVLVANLAGPVTRWSNCIKITRRDGRIFGFTDHLLDLVVGGVTYEASTGLDASTLDNSVGTGVDSIEVLGVVKSDRIAAPDIRAGVWDAAKVEFFWVDWNDLAQGPAVLLTGTIGEITEAEGQFKAEIRSLSQHYSQSIGKECSLTCRVKEFPDECFVSAAGVAGTNYDGTQTAASHKFSGAVVTAWSASNPRFVTFDGPTTPAGGDTKASNYYRWGKVTFETGANAGFSMDVKGHTINAGTAVIELQRPFPYAVQLGDTAQLIAGCDRTLSMCAGTFQNVGNLDAEPHVPGPEAILKTGRKSEPADKFSGLRARVVR